MTDKKTQYGKVQRRPAWLLAFGIILRAMHQVGAAVYLCSYLFPTTIPLPSIYFWLCIVSGIVLLVTEAARHRQMYKELTGVSTMLKLILFGAAFHGFLPATTTVLLAFCIASICAHAPKNIRHKLLF